MHGIALELLNRVLYVSDNGIISMVISLTSFKFICMHTWTHTHACTHAYTHTHTHTHTHTYTQAHTIIIMYVVFYPNTVQTVIISLYTGDTYCDTYES